jgi:hypothetical protein
MEIREDENRIPSPKRRVLKYITGRYFRKKEDDGQCLETYHHHHRLRRIDDYKLVLFRNGVWILV